MLRALGPWGILTVAGAIGMCIWRFESRRVGRLGEADDARESLTDDHDLGHPAYEYERDDVLFLADEAIEASHQTPPLGPDDCPEFIETLERFVRPSD